MSLTNVEDLDLEPVPVGELALQTLAMPKDTNANGDIFGGWLVSQMDLAAAIATKQVTRGRSATVAIKNVAFLAPVSVLHRQLLCRDHRDRPQLHAHQHRSVDLQFSDACGPAQGS